MRKFFLALYYCILRWLPNNSAGAIGRFSGRLRYMACRRIFPRLGHHSNIARGVYFGDGSRIELGNYSGLGPNCQIRQCHLCAGDYLMMAPDVLILGGGHCTDDLSTPMGEQGNLPPSRLVIKDDVWIGQRAIILGKTSVIGTKAIIAAGAVVTKPVPDYAVVAGNPARVVKYRNTGEP